MFDFLKPKPPPKRNVYRLKRYRVRQNLNVWLCNHCQRLFIKHKMYFQYPYLPKPPKVYCPRCLAINFNSIRRNPNDRGITPSLRENIA